MLSYTQEARAHTQAESFLQYFQRLMSYTKPPIFETPETSYMRESQQEYVHMDIPASLQRYERIRRELGMLFNRLKMFLEKGLIDEPSIKEILEQKIIFEERRAELEEEYHGKVVVVCNGEVFVGETIDDAVAKAKAKHGNRPYYSEALGITDFPSVLF